VAWIVVLALSLSRLLCRSKLAPGGKAALGLEAADGAGLPRYAARRTYAPLSCVRAYEEEREVRKIGLAHAVSGLVEVVWIRQSPDWGSSSHSIFSSVLPLLLKDASARQERLRKMYSFFSKDDLSQCSSRTPNRPEVGAPPIR
jgi:hypothetical protein